VSSLDWLALGFVALAGVVGLRKGLVASFLSVIGIVAGALIGARIAPHFLPSGDRSPYTPLVALGGAVVCAAILEGAGSMAGAVIRRAMLFPPLRALDSAGGLVLGAATGLAVVWIAGAAALLLPGEPGIRQEAQRSSLLRHLNDLVPPVTLLHVLARVDPFPEISGPAAPAEPPTAAVLRVPAIRRAAPSVVRVLGTACGLGIEGTGWVAAPGLVVTAAHVVAGETDTTVQQAGSSVTLRARPIAFDSRNDVAVLRVRGLRARPLPLAEPVPGAAVAIVGYPEDGPLDSTPGRIGRTATVLSRDAYGHGPVTRTITAVGGLIRHGNSGGPAIDSRGRVESTLFAVRLGTKSGYGIPSEIVRNVIAGAAGPVSTGACAP
jgi:S1-C subfamily serine protease